MYLYIYINNITYIHIPMYIKWFLMKILWNCPNMGYPPIPALSSTTAILGAHTAISDKPKYDSAIHIPHNIPDEYM